MRTAENMHCIFIINFTFTSTARFGVFLGFSLLERKKCGHISLLGDKIQAETDPQIQQKGKALQNRNTYSQMKFTK